MCWSPLATIAAPAGPTADADGQSSRTAGEMRPTAARAAVVRGGHEPPEPARHSTPNRRARRTPCRCGSTRPGDRDGYGDARRGDGVAGGVGRSPAGPAPDPAVDVDREGGHGLVRRTPRRSGAARRCGPAPAGTGSRGRRRVCPSRSRWPGAAAPRPTARRVPAGRPRRCARAPSRGPRRAAGPRPATASGGTGMRAPDAASQLPTARAPGGWWSEPQRHTAPSARRAAWWSSAEAMAEAMAVAGPGSGTAAGVVRHGA